MKHVNALPDPPSKRSGKPIGAALEALLLRCLAKLPADRPRDAADLLRELENCPIEDSWTTAQAAAWWAAHFQANPLSDRDDPGATRITGGPETPRLDATMAYDHLRQQPQPGAADPGMP